MNENPCSLSPALSDICDGILGFGCRLGFGFGFGLCGDFIHHDGRGMSFLNLPHLRACVFPPRQAKKINEWTWRHVAREEGCVGVCAIFIIFPQWKAQTHALSKGIKFWQPENATNFHWILSAATKPPPHMPFKRELRARNNVMRYWGGRNFANNSMAPLYCCTSIRCFKFLLHSLFITYFSFGSFDFWPTNDRTLRQFPQTDVWQE